MFRIEGKYEWTLKKKGEEKDSKEKTEEGRQGKKGKYAILFIYFG